MARGDDFEELRQLSARYAHFADFGGADDVALLFAEDGVWDGRQSGQPLREGHDAIRDGFTRGPAAMRWFHLTGNHVVTRIDGETAEGSEYAMAVSAVEKSHLLFALTRLDDEYVKTADGWRFRKRTLVPLMRARLAQAPEPS
jgi:hypothetical protein